MFKFSEPTLQSSFETPAKQVLVESKNGSCYTLLSFSTTPRRKKCKVPNYEKLKSETRSPQTLSCNNVTVAKQNKLFLSDEDACFKAKKPNIVSTETDSSNDSEVVQSTPGPRTTKQTMDINSFGITDTFKKSVTMPSRVYKRIEKASASSEIVCGPVTSAGRVKKGQTIKKENSLIVNTPARRVTRVIQKNQEAASPFVTPARRVMRMIQKKQENFSPLFTPARRVQKVEMQQNSSHIEKTGKKTLIFSTPTRALRNVKSGINTQTSEALPATSLKETPVSKSNLEKSPSSSKKSFLRNNTNMTTPKSNQLLGRRIGVESSVKRKLLQSESSRKESEKIKKTLHIRNKLQTGQALEFEKKKKGLRSQERL